MAEDASSLPDQLRDGGALRGEALAPFRGRHFATDALGFELDEVSLERVVAHLDCDERHHQPYGIVHGGVWCTVIESMASIGAATHAMLQGRRAVGINNSTDFLRAHRHGRIEGVAEPVHVGRNQHLWQVVLTRDDGKAVARGQVRLQIVDAEQLPPTDGAGG